MSFKEMSCFHYDRIRGTSPLSGIAFMNKSIFSRSLLRGLRRSKTQGFYPDREKNRSRDEARVSL